MSVQIRQSFINQNRSKELLHSQGAVVHSTATPGATDTAERNFFNNGDRGASAHCFVDWDSATQTIPWNEVAYHAMHTANYRFVGIELCEPDGYNLAQFNAVWNNGVDVFAQYFINVLKVYIITKDNLMSHAEVSAKWHESDHTDPVAFFNRYGKTVDQFRADVQAKINEYRNILPDKLCIDAPRNFQVFGDNFELSGWALSSVNKVRLFVNGIDEGIQPLTLPRADVAKAFPKYNKSKVGFKWGILISALKKGENKLTIRSGNASQTVIVYKK